MGKTALHNPGIPSDPPGKLVTSCWGGLGWRETPLAGFPSLWNEGLFPLQWFPLRVRNPHKIWKGNKEINDVSEEMHPGLWELFSIKFQNPRKVWLEGKHFPLQPAQGLCLSQQFCDPSHRKTWEGQDSSSFPYTRAIDPRLCFMG